MRYVLPALLLIATAPLARAEVLLFNSVQAEAATASSRPHQGQTMDQVKTKYGQPTTRHAAVGDPPITRWDYPDFSVYFEYQRVIHSVPAKVEPHKSAP